MKARLDPRRAKLPPILEIDEYGIAVSEHEGWGHPRWAGAEDGEALQMGDWPTEFDD